MAVESNAGGGQLAPVGLDLVAPEMYVPVLRRLAVLAVLLGVGAGLVASTVLAWPTAVLVGVVVGAPTAGYALAARRRRMSLTGTVLRVQRVLRRRTIDVAAAEGVELLVYPARVSRVALRVTASGETQLIPLAMYTDAGSGRELHPLGLRRLADALSAGTLAAAVAVSGVLVDQLRAEARDAPLESRPLYRAARLGRAQDVVSPLVLSDRQVAELS